MQLSTISWSISLTFSTMNIFVSCKQTLASGNKVGTVRSYLLDIDVLLLEIVENICESLKSQQVSSANVLGSLSNGYKAMITLQQSACVPRRRSSRSPKHITSTSNDLDNFTKSRFVESLGYAAGVDSTHRVVGSIVGVALDSTLHGNATIEHNVNEGRDRETSAMEARAEYSPSE
jgi:hypothetical protein